MGQLKEVRQKQWRERARESLLSIGKKDGWNKGAGSLTLSLLQRPSGLGSLRVEQMWEKKV